MIKYISIKRIIHINIEISQLIMNMNKIILNKCNNKMKVYMIIIY